MPRSVIAYDKDLPEISGRRPWEKPSSDSVKDDAAATGWREETSRHRPSRLLLVPKIRAAVDAARGRLQGRVRRHTAALRVLVRGGPRGSWLRRPVPLLLLSARGYRDASAAVEIAGLRDAQKLIRADATKFKRDLLTDNIVFQTTMDGRRQLRRYVPELDAEGVQDLPPENLRRFAYAGTYANNESCGVSATGTGEFFMRNIVAADICERVRYLHVSMEQAANDVVMKELVDQKGDGGVIALDRQGNVTTPFNTTGMMTGTVRSDGQISLKGWSKTAEPIVVPATQ